MLNFAANLSMLFTEHPFLSRFEAAAQAGFQGVEFLSPYDWKAAELAVALQDAQVEQVLFNLPPGDWKKGERGMACQPGREQEFREGVDLALDYARYLKTPRLHAMAGLMPDDVPMEQLRQTFKENMIFAAQRCSDVGVELLIEPINPINMPGYFLNDFGLAIDLIEEMAEQGGAAPRLQFDFFHCARIHGDIAPWLERSSPLIGHYQIAGPPARHEPDDASSDWGSQGYLPLLLLAQERTPDLWVGCEYLPAAQTQAGLGWMKAARCALGANA